MPINEVSILRGLLAELLFTLDSKPDNIFITASSVRAELDDLESMLQHERDEAHRSRIRAAVEAGADEFWRSIAKSFPEVKTGDLDPMSDAALTECMTRVVSRWWEINVLSGGDDE